MALSGDVATNYNRFIKDCSKLGRLDISEIFKFDNQRLLSTNRLLAKDLMRKISEKDNPAEYGRVKNLEVALVTLTKACVDSRPIIERGISLVLQRA